MKIINLFPAFQIESLIIKIFDNNWNSQCFIQASMNPSRNIKFGFYCLSSGSLILLALKKDSLNFVFCQRSRIEKSRRWMISPSQYGTEWKYSSDSVINLCQVMNFFLCWNRFFAAKREWGAVQCTWRTGGQFEKTNSVSYFRIELLNIDKSISYR